MNVPNVSSEITDGEVVKVSITNAPEIARLVEKITGLGTATVDDSTVSISVASGDIDGAIESLLGPTNALETVFSALRDARDQFASS